MNICHMAAKEHPEVIEVRQQLIAVCVLDYEEAAEYASIDCDGANFDEYGRSELLFFS